MIHEVKMERQAVLPPAVLATMVGTQWWRKNCHGAKTLMTIDGISHPDVRAAFSTFKWHGENMTLIHEGPHAWLRRTVETADEGKAVRAGTFELDDSLFIPSPGRTKQPPTPGQRSTCRLQVRKSPESDVLVQCNRRIGHDGECTPKKRGVRGSRVWNR